MVTTADTRRVAWIVVVALAGVLGLAPPALYSLGASPSRATPSDVAVGLVQAVAGGKNIVVRLDRGMHLGSDVVRPSHDPAMGLTDGGPPVHGSGGWIDVSYASGDWRGVDVSSAAARAPPLAARSV